MRQVCFGGALLVAAVCLAYHGILSYPFYFDDVPAIVDNPTIRNLSRLGEVLSPPANGTAVTGRPLVNLSFALNYALGGLAPAGYHAFNLALHAAAALALFGLLRHTLRRQVLAARFGTYATPLAFVAALLWAVHPLQTESVTCVAQRTELLVGFFYLLTLYAFARGAGSARSALWLGLSLAACFLGMASKEVMVSAPLLVFIYDRTFVAGSFRAAWSARWKFYLGLAASWFLLAALVLSAGGGRGAAAGFGRGMSSWHYLLKQCEAIVHYIRLAIWPDPLVVDYGVDVVERLSAVLPQALVLVAALGLTLFALGKRPALGFVGLWFFAILAPSSSVVPLVAQTMAEHRMYLPLAALTTLVVLGAYVAFDRRTLPIALATALALGVVTVGRNQDYRTELTLWSVTVAQRPQSPRAHANLGVVLLQSGATAAAVHHLDEAVRLQPDYPDARQNLGTGLLLLGRVDEAVAQFEQLLRLTPSSGEAHSNLGLALLQAGRLEPAVAHGREAVRLLPASPETHYNFATTLAAAGQPAEALGEFDTALRVAPGHGMAHFGRGRALLALGRGSEASAALERAVALLPGFIPAREALAEARAAARP